MLFLVFLSVGASQIKEFTKNFFPDTLKILSALHLKIMKNLLSSIWKRVYSYSFILTVLVTLSLFLTGKIVYNFQKNDREKHESILLLTKTADSAVFQGFIPPKTALPMLEHAYRMGGNSVKPYAGFLSSCFYIHNEPLRGAYYAGLAYSSGAKFHMPSPAQVLLKEIADAQATQDYQAALEKSSQLLQLSASSEDYPTLRFLTLLRIIEIKEILNQDTETDFEELKTLPLFKEFEQFYKDGEWTLTKRFGKKH
ncbi:hypothetical protein C834K_0063 [Chlamydia poikilotherma]|uniref:Uncharacterized protein n=2 Tax=Chlamydia poikilotherma TaxID=1967783 RepID=A0A3B0PQT1_9CHLA|nr:hypothetical protein C834K_0063 [Chlamydia poikilotherma]